MSLSLLLNIYQCFHDRAEACISLRRKKMLTTLQNQGKPSLTASSDHKTKYASSNQSTNLKLVSTFMFVQHPVILQWFMIY
jgi:endonuclease/exonuclease/phosphatase (EEP) superfamily protein YafD